MMLVLSRKVGERVILAGGIVVQVLEVSGRRVRLGIEAPREVTILREELSSAEEPAATCERAVRKPR
jgi:carbon storage regulator